jgi:tetratricopeptide (TPR) repeat protein
MARVPLPDDVDARDLDRDTRKELMSLAKDTAETVARHLVMAGRLMDDDPEAALAHARAARALAGRVGAVREANGLVAYLAGEWAEALSELRTARRLTGDPEHLAVMADCERALGRPDRALLVVEDPQASSLSPATRVELLIVASGARRDLGQADAAVVSLQVAALEGPVRPWTARLRYAYADALLTAGREAEARQWFSRAADVDEDGQTDAEERLLALDGVVLDDLLEEDDAEQEPMAAADLAALVADMSTGPDVEADVEPEVESDVEPDVQQASPSAELPAQVGAEEALAGHSIPSDEAHDESSAGADASADEPEPARHAAVDLTHPFAAPGPGEPEAVAAPVRPAVQAPGFREPPASQQQDPDGDDDLTLFD